MDKQRFQYLARTVAPKPTYLANAAKAFVVGGLITTVGQVLMQFYMQHGFTQKTAGEPTAITLVFLSALFTALGLYDRLVQFGGMGAALPITGFANAVTAPAMEFRREGLVLGTASRIFQIAGPVLVFGLSSAFLVGLMALAWRAVVGG